MANFDFSHYKVSRVDGLNAFTTILLIFFALTIGAVAVSCLIIGVIFIYGSKWLASKYDNIKGFRKSFFLLSILAILCQAISLLLFFFLHHQLWIYCLSCLIGTLLGSIIIATVNKINRDNEERERKKMYLYCYVLNFIILLFNISPWFYMDRMRFWEDCIGILLMIIHIVMSGLGRFFEETLYKFE